MSESKPTAGSGSGRGPAAAGPVPWSRVVWPAEHGGWSLLAEPLALGLVAAPSPAGALVAAAAACGFLARQPLRFALGDRRRGRRYPRTAAAERALAALSLLGALALAGAWALARGPLPVAVALAAPLAAAALALDLGGRSREAAAESLAALALGGAAPAVALAAGWPLPHALALWAVAAARGVPTVLFVRARLRLDRGEAAARFWPLAAAALAAAVMAALAARGLLTAAAAWAMAALAARAAWGLSPARPRWSTARLGATEAALGGLLALGVGLAERLAGRP
uniref:Prenyltransferase n=1 Tax=Eiseniibacteriota bacterium TaxID=2212470 RepID=A0A832IA64_UNCEI